MSDSRARSLMMEVGNSEKPMSKYKERIGQDKQMGRVNKDIPFTKDNKLVRLLKARRNVENSSVCKKL